MMQIKQVNIGLAIAIAGLFLNSTAHAILGKLTLERTVNRHYSVYKRTAGTDSEPNSDLSSKHSRNYSYTYTHVVNQVDQKVVSRKEGLLFRVPGEQVGSNSKVLGKDLKGSSSVSLKFVHNPEGESQMYLEFDQTLDDRIAQCSVHWTSQFSMPVYFVRGDWDSFLWGQTVELWPMPEGEQAYLDSQSSRMSSLMQQFLKCNRFESLNFETSQSFIKPSGWRRLISGPRFVIKADLNHIELDMPPAEYFLEMQVDGLAD